MFGNGREGGMIDDANDGDPVDPVDDEDENEDGEDEEAGDVELLVVLLVEMDGDGESSLTREDEAKDEASCIWGITDGRASCLPTSDTDSGSDSVERAMDAIVV